MNSDLEERLGLAREALAQRLSSVYKTWTIEGENIIGPGTLAVRVEDQHNMGPQHFDIGFVLNRNRTEVPVLSSAKTSQKSVSTAHAISRPATF